MLDKANSLTIGGLAKAANVNVETIRYYQRRSLNGTQTASRWYSTLRLDIDRLTFVKTAQQLGFGLKR